MIGRPRQSSGPSVAHKGTHAVIAEVGDAHCGRAAQEDMTIAVITRTDSQVQVKHALIFPQDEKNQQESTGREGRRRFVAGRSSAIETSDPPFWLFSLLPKLAPYFATSQVPRMRS